MESVAITGVGLICALGASMAQVWPRLMRGEHGISSISRFDASAYPARVAGQVAIPSSAPDGAGELDAVSRRGTQLFRRAAREAWEDAHASGLHDGASGGVSVGVSVNYLHMATLRSLWQHRDTQANRVDLSAALDQHLLPKATFLRRHGQTAAAVVARDLGLFGPRCTIDTACASGAHAIIDAARAVARGETPVMVAGAGSGLIVPITLLAFGRIGALTANPDPDTASRPFDRRRDGFVLGEGAAAVVLEPMSRAEARGARVYAELRGAATSVNAHSLTDPSPEGRTETATIAEALRDARVDPPEVDYIAAHGTSTVKNDETETKAIRQALGVQAGRVLVSSNKGQLGHTLPAAGAINIVVAAMALAAQCVPPTAHWRERDSACDLDYVPGTGRPAPVAVALAHAFAFGGQNAVVVLTRPRHGRVGRS